MTNLLQIWRHRESQDPPRGAGALVGRGDDGRKKTPAPLFREFPDGDRHVLRLLISDNGNADRRARFGFCYHGT